MHAISGLIVAISTVIASPVDVPPSEPSSDTVAPTLDEDEDEPEPEPEPEGEPEDTTGEAQRWRDALPPTILGAHVAAAGTNVTVVEVDRDPTVVGAPASLVAEQLEASRTAGQVRVVRAVDRGEAQSDADIVQAVAKEDTARVVLLRLAEVDGEPRMSILVYERDGKLVSAVTASPGVPIPRPPDQGVPRAIQLEAEEEPPPPDPAVRREVADSRTTRDAPPPTTDHRRNARIGLAVAGSVVLAGGIVAVVGGLSACEPGCDTRRNAVAGGVVLTVVGSGLLFGGLALKPAPGPRGTVWRQPERSRVRVATSLSREHVGVQLGGRF